MNTLFEMIKRFIRDANSVYNIVDYSDNHPKPALEAMSDFDLNAVLAVHYGIDEKWVIKRSDWVDNYCAEMGRDSVIEEILRVQEQEK